MRNTFLASVLTSVLFSVSACSSGEKIKLDVPAPAPPVVETPAVDVKVEPVTVAPVAPVVEKAKPIVTPPPVAVEVKPTIEHPKTASDFMTNARAYVEMGERGKAIAAANKAVKLAPDSTSAWNVLGRAELLRKDYDAALVAFGKAVELDPGNAWAWNNLGFTKLEMGKYADAIEPLEKATALPAATGYMWNNLGTAYEHEDRLDEAREAFDKGGKSGSVAAASSRKRLQGVATLAVKESKKVAVEDKKAPDPEVQETTPVVAVPTDAGVEQVQLDAQPVEPVAEKPAPAPQG